MQASLYAVQLRRGEEQHHEPKKKKEKGETYQFMSPAATKNPYPDICVTCERRTSKEMLCAANIRHSGPGNGQAIEFVT
jgi:hypothetical protein